MMSMESRVQFDGSTRSLRQGSGWFGTDSCARPGIAVAGRVGHVEGGGLERCQRRRRSCRGVGRRAADGTIFDGWI